MSLHKAGIDVNNLDKELDGLNAQLSQLHKQSKINLKIESNAAKIGNLKQ